MQNHTENAPHAGARALLAFAMLLLTACSSSSAPPAASAAQTGMNGVKAHVVGRSAALSRAAAALRTAAQAYLELGRTTNFDYAALAEKSNKDVLKRILEAREAWRNASTAYAQMEGIVAGVPALADFDLILDTGTSEEEGDESVVPFDLKLPDGRTLPKPGNLFGVLEGTLWGTVAKYHGTGNVKLDLDGDGAVGFGDVLPDANVLVGAADALVDYVGQLERAAGEWQPTDKDAYLALTIMLPSIGDYFTAWKESRFVAGDDSAHTDYVAISRVTDLDAVMMSLKILFAGVEPQLNQIDAQSAGKLNTELNALADVVSQTAKAEADGKHFTPAEASALADRAMRSGEQMADIVTTLAQKTGIKLDE